MDRLQLTGSAELDSRYENVLDSVAPLLVIESQIIESLDIQIFQLQCLRDEARARCNALEGLVFTLDGEDMV